MRREPVKVTDQQEAERLDLPFERAALIDARNGASTAGLDTGTWLTAGSANHSGGSSVGRPSASDEAQPDGLDPLGPLLGPRMVLGLGVRAATGTARGRVRTPCGPDAASLWRSYSAYRLDEPASA